MNMDFLLHISEFDSDTCGDYVDSVYANLPRNLNHILWRHCCVTVIETGQLPQLHENRGLQLLSIDGIGCKSFDIIHSSQCGYDDASNNWSHYNDLINAERQRITPNVCETCYFYAGKPDDDTEDGECHRYPPSIPEYTVIPCEEDGKFELFVSELWCSVVKPYNWCGEYKREEN